MAVDDAYSRYVMTLRPQRYLRFRDIATGHVVARDEVFTGPGLAGVSSLPGRHLYSSALAAGNVGSGILLPGLTAATFLQLRSDRYVRLNHSTVNYLDTSMTTALTDNSWACQRSVPNINNMTVNYWYRVPTDQGAVNDRLFSIPGGETWDGGTSANKNVLHTFSWNGSTNKDAGLVEAVFKKPSQVLGTSYMWNVGNNENYRYLSHSAFGSNPVNTVNMATLVVGLDYIRLYRNGVPRSQFTWNPDDYGLMEPHFGDNWVFGVGSWSGSEGYGLNDLATADVAELSVHRKQLSDAEVAELYVLGVTGAHSRVITGSVVDVLGNPLSRVVRAHAQTDGRVLAETNSEAVNGGAFTLRTPGAYTGHIYILAFDDTTLAPDYNAAIHSNLVPTA